MSCTCPDFKKRRANFDKTDPRRICKHLMKHVDPFDIQDQHLSDIYAFLKSNDLGYPTSEKVFKTFGKDKVTAFIANDAQKKWIDVFTGQHRFGFNVDENRWSYKEEPKHGKIIGKWLIECWNNVNSAGA